MNPARPDPPCPPRVAAALSRRRLELARSLRGFCAAYLPHHLSAPPSPMHLELAALLEEASEARGRRIAVAAPRGHAKSTLVSLAYVLWSLCVRGEPFALLVSATAPQAAALLRAVRDELASNARLRADFPGHVPPPPPARPSPSWRADRLDLPTGQAAYALGVDQQVRGLRKGPHRPSLIVLDDAETPAGCATEEGRLRLRDAVDRSLLKAGDGATNVVMVGTVLHHDSLLARRLDPRESPGWTARRYRALVRPPSDAALWARHGAVYRGEEGWPSPDRTGPDAARAFYLAHRAAMDAGAEVLWPEREPLEGLMALRIREGEASFAAEKQNEPLDPERCVFAAAALRYWTDEHPGEEALRAAVGELRVFVAWDPALGAEPGRGGRGDDSAIVAVGADAAGTLYVLEADVRRAGVDASMERLCALARALRPARCVLEANGFQSLLERPLRELARERGVDLPLRAVRSAADKRSRIALLQPLVSRGALRFHRGHARLLDQLRQFPLGAHDDGPDALQMAVQAALEPPPRVAAV